VPEPPKSVVSLTLDLDIGNARCVFDALSEAQDEYPGVLDPDEPGPLIAAICNAWSIEIDEQNRAKFKPAPSTPSPIEINPDVAALLERLEAFAEYLYREENPHTFLPRKADDIRRAVELIRFGRRSTGQPDAGKREDDSR
jgi:hypothetical protein